MSRLEASEPGVRDAEASIRANAVAAIAIELTVAVNVTPHSLLALADDTLADDSSWRRPVLVRTMEGRALGTGTRADVDSSDR